MSLEPICMAAYDVPLVATTSAATEMKKEGTDGAWVGLSVMQATATHCPLFGARAHPDCRGPPS